MQYKRRFPLYSIPLNTPDTSRYFRMVQACRMNMIETFLESSWSPLSENIYIMRSIPYSFLQKKQNVKFLKH